MGEIREKSPLHEALESVADDHRRPKPRLFREINQAMKRRMGTGESERGRRDRLGHGPPILCDEKGHPPTAGGLSWLLHRGRPQVLAVFDAENAGQGLANQTL